MKLHVITATVVTAAMLTTGAVAASAAPSDETVAASDCQFGQHLLHAWMQLPTDLRGDLKALRDLEPGERASAARDIRDDALSGEYGDGVQARAEKARERRIGVIRTMPAELKADLVELKRTPPAERRDLAREIADTALDGGYGEKTREVAESIQASDAWQNCVAD